MAEIDRQFEVRQLLKAYRKGLISDELFAEQMREIDGGAAVCTPSPARVYSLRRRTFSTERDLIVRFLDEFRAGESFGGEIFHLWCKASRDPALRGGLRVVAEREASHGRLLEARLSELGGRCEVSLPESLRDAARARLSARDVSDLDKIRDLTRRLPDVDAAVEPIRNVIAQIEQDHETRTLLALLIDEETSTLRWLHAMERQLAGAERTAASAPARPEHGNGSACPS
jgi:hypothetical protein